jgi:hypothetical protein
MSCGVSGAPTVVADGVGAAVDGVERRLPLGVSHNAGSTLSPGGGESFEVAFIGVPQLKVSTAGQLIGISTALLQRP